MLRCILEGVQSDALADWQIPPVPHEASWCDLSERKQRQAREGKPIPFFRELPPWAVRDQEVASLSSAD